MAIADYPVFAAGEPQAASVASSAPWSLPMRIAFRFCFLYFGLYICLGQMVTSLLMFLPELDYTGPATAIVKWLASHVFRIGHAIGTTQTGSGDQIYDWIALTTILTLAILGTLVWSTLDRKNESYVKLHTWFRLFIRFSLAATMFTYGAFKVIPVQMPFPSLETLLEPYGHFSRAMVLWSSVGASPPYEIFAGSAEMLAAILLVLPRTSTLGAMVCLADAIQIFVLNMTYDVPVKLLSFHLILISLFLLSYDAPRLLNLFFFPNRAAPAAPHRTLFRSTRANRIAVALQIAFGLWLLGFNLYSVTQQNRAYGAAAPKSALYGIWNVQDFTMDGQTQPPLITNSARWRRVVFESMDGDYMFIHTMNDDGNRYGTKIDVKAGTIALTRSEDKTWKANLSFTRPALDHLILDGAIDNHKIHADLRLFDLSKFSLVSDHMHWIHGR